jgi:large subunit ribosomal protein L22
VATTVPQTQTDGRVEARAEAKWVRTSARKARLVLDLIRGRSVPEARSVLAFSERAVARDIELVLRSAVANAETNHGLIGDELFVSAAYADEGPTLKRWRARARGRVARIRKRTCHITVKVAARPEEATRPRRRAAAATTTEPAEAPKPRRRGRRAEGGGETETTEPKRRTRTKKKETAA